MKEGDFEKSLADLEGVVAKLETGGLGLNESLTLFEKGVKLSRFLRAELDKAEKKVEILLKNDQGGFEEAPFGLEEAEDRSGSAEPGPEAASEDGPPSGAKKPRPKTKKPADDDTLPF